MEEVPEDIGKDKPLAMDKAYEGDACRVKAEKCGMLPVVPPKSNRKEPWTTNVPNGVKSSRCLCWDGVKCL